MEVPLSFWNPDQI